MDNLKISDFWKITKYLWYAELA